MSNYLLLLFIIQLSQVSFGQKDSTVNKFTFLDYGMVFNDNYYLSRNEVSKQWNIHYKRVASCMVGDDLIDSVRIHNAKVSEELSGIYGDNWEDRYNSQWAKLLDSLDNETKRAERENKLLKTKQIALKPEPSSVAMEVYGANVLFRGYDNKIIPATFAGIDSMTLYSSDCSISRPDGKNYFIVRPSSNKTTEVTLCSVENDSIIPLKTNIYRVVNLPDPALYWGNNKSGTSADLKTLTIEAKFDPIYPLENNFEIVKWTITHSNVTFSGEGNDLSTAKGLLDTFEEESIITITTVVRANDGISRQLAGIWKM